MTVRIVVYHLYASVSDVWLYQYRRWLGKHAPTGIAPQDWREPAHGRMFAERRTFGGL